MFGKKNLPSIFGSSTFIELIKAKYYLTKKHAEVSQSKVRAPIISDIKKAVSQCSGIDIKNLGQVNRGQENVPRNIAIYLSRKHCGLSLEEIGKQFGFIKYSTVSNIVKKVERQRGNDRQLSKIIASARQKLSLEQGKI